MNYDEINEFLDLYEDRFQSLIEIFIKESEENEIDFSLPAAILLQHVENILTRICIILKVFDPEKDIVSDLVDKMKEKIRKNMETYEKER